MTNSRKQVLKRLFVSTLYLSTFTFGGGYVIISLMKKKFVDEYHWIEEEEMLDLTAIAQSAPGAVAVNGAIVVGYKLAGAAGVLISILGTVIPPFVILSLISVCYQAFRENWLVSHMLEGMQAGVGAVIASVTYEMGAGVLKEKDFLSVWIRAGAFFTSVFHLLLHSFFISSILNELSLKEKLSYSLQSSLISSFSESHACGPKIISIFSRFSKVIGKCFFKRHIFKSILTSK